MKRLILTLALVSGLWALDSNAGEQFNGIVTRGRVTRTGFENLTRDGSDLTNFRVGPALFTGGVAATRAFGPGYHRGHFVFITAGQLGVTSTIRFDRGRNRVHFFAKDIRELIPATRGRLVVTYQGGGVQTVFLSGRFRPYRFKDVRSISVVTNGVSNIDTFTVVSLPRGRGGDQARGR